MKKIYLAAALAILAAGCGGKGDEGKGTADYVSPYQAAVDAAKITSAQSKKLIVMAMMPATALAADKAVGALLEANAPALELFRETAGRQGDGYFLSAKPEKPTLPDLTPVYPGSAALFRLLIVDARLNLGEGKREAVERDLLAALGYMNHLAEQDSSRTMATLFLVQAMKEAWPLIWESLRGSGASAEYTEGVSSYFDKIYSTLDLMDAAMTEDGEAFKNDIRKAMTPAAIRKSMKDQPWYKRVLASFIQNKEYRETVVGKFSAIIDSRVEVCREAFKTNEIAAAKELMESQRPELEAMGRTGGMRERLAGMTVAKLSEKALSNCYEAVIRYHRLYASVGIMRTALAVRAYRAAHKGRLPASLEALSPDFLDKLPADPSNGFAPFTYAPVGDGFIVHARAGVQAFVDYSDKSVKGAKRSKWKRAVSGNN